MTLLPSEGDDYCCKLLSIVPFRVFVALQEHQPRLNDLVNLERFRIYFQNFHARSIPARLAAGRVMVSVMNKQFPGDCKVIEF